MSASLGKIVSKRIPSIYPYKDYSDNILFDEDDNRVVFIDFISEIFNTDRRFQTIEGENQNKYASRKIQSIVSKKYELQIITKENNGLSLLNASDIIEVYLEDGTVHNAQLIETVESEFIDTGRQFRRFTITYIDLNTQAYANYLKSDTLINDLGILSNSLWELKLSSKKLSYEQYTILDTKIQYLGVTSWILAIDFNDLTDTMNADDEINIITSNSENNKIHTIGTVFSKDSNGVYILISAEYFDYQNSNITINWEVEEAFEYNFYTKLKPYFQETDKQEETNLVNGINKVRSSISQKIAFFQFYLEEDNKNIVKKLARIWKVNLSYVDNNNYYLSLEGVIPEINEDSEMVNCFDVLIPVKIENNINDRY